MNRRIDMFSKIVKILPRAYLEEQAQVERPWAFSRQELEANMIAADNKDLRRELADYVGIMLGVNT